MFDFDLQRFDEEESQSIDAESSQENQPEPQPEEKEPLPEELNGLPEDIARDTYEEWKKSQQQEQPPVEQQAPPQETAAQPPKTEESVPYARFKEKVDEANALKEQLAEYQRKAQQQAQPQPQGQAPPPPQQLPPIKVTPEIARDINRAIEAEAMALSGFTQDDVDSLQYADDDDPRIVQYQQAKSIAQSNIFSALRQARTNQHVQEQQQYAAAQQFRAAQAVAINSYHEFAKKEFADPNFKAIQNFAVNQFFAQLPPDEQAIVSNAYVRSERQIATPAEYMVVKNYYERAKAVYLALAAREKQAKGAPAQPKQAPSLPRVDSVKGTANIGNDGQLSSSEIEKLLEGDFTKIDSKTQKLLLGMT